MSKESAQALRQYVEGQPDLRSRLMAIAKIHAKQTDTPGLLDKEENTELSMITDELIFGLKENDDGELVPDVKHFEEAARIFNEIRNEAKIRSYDEAKILGEQFTKRDGENFRHSTWVENADDPTLKQTVEKYEDLNFNKALFYGGMSEDNRIDFACQNLTLEFEQSSYMDSIKDAMGLSENTIVFELFQKEALKQKDPDQQEKIRIVSNHSRLSADKKQAELCAFDEHGLKAAIETTKYTAERMSKPWLPPKEEAACIVKTAGTKAIRADVSLEKLKETARNLNALRENMKKNMSSTFKDSDAYKKLMKALDKPVLKNMDKFVDYVDEKNMKDNLITVMNEVKQTAASYMSIHMSNRSSSTGQKRFEAAFAAVAMIDEKAADLISEQVNHIRSKENDAQLLDTQETLKKQNAKSMVEDFGLSIIKEQKDLMKAEKKEKMSSQELLEDMENTFEKNINKLLPEEYLEEMKQVQLACGIKHQNIGARVSSNILGYYYMKHPEDRNLLMDDLLEKKEFQNAPKEYMNFLKANPIYKVKDGKVVGKRSERTVAKSTDALAKYHDAWAKSMREGIVIPDLTDETIRKSYMGMIRQRNKEYIDWSQNEESLRTNQLPYMQNYPGGIKAWQSNNDGMSAAATIMTAALELDNMTHTPVSRAAMRYFLESEKANIVGKTPDQLSADNDRYVARYNAFLYTASQMEKEVPKNQLQEYAAGKSKPDSIHAFWEKHKAELDQMTNDLMTVFKADREKAPEKYKYVSDHPEKQTVKKISFNAMEKGINTKSQKKEHMKDAISHDVLEKESKKKTMH